MMHALYSSRAHPHAGMHPRNTSMPEDRSWADAVRVHAVFCARTAHAVVVCVCACCLCEAYLLHCQRVCGLALCCGSRLPSRRAIGQYDVLHAGRHGALGPALPLHHHAAQLERQALLVSGALLSKLQFNDAQTCQPEREPPDALMDKLVN